MNTTQVGRQAEAQAAAYLRQYGYEVLQQNWRTRYCEIDLIAAKAGIIYFVEVKYRSRIQQGSALDYITPTKLRQMQLAARWWVARYKWSGDYRMAAMAIDPVVGMQLVFM